MKSTSLTNKISLILRLNDLTKLVANNIAIASNNPELRNLQGELFNPQYHNGTRLNRLELSILYSGLAGLVGLAITLEKEAPAHLLLTLMPLGSLVLTGLVKITDMIDSHPHNMSLTECFCNYGSHFGLPIPTLYYLYQYYTKKIPHDKQLLEMKREQKNIQNLIEEFKESVKNEYAL